MAYFVVERSKEDGTLRIPLSDAYDTREAAIAALSSATSTGAVSLTGEVFIADLGSAVPVLVMQSAPAPAPSEVPAEDVEAEVEVEAEPEAEEPAAEALDEDVSMEPAALDENGAVTAFSSWEPLEEIESSETALADALKRAATSLEGEGIVAPDSVLSGDEIESAEVVEEASAPEAEAEEETVLETALGEPPVESEPSSEDDRDWPWANVEAYEIKVDADALLEETDGDALEPLEVTEPEPEIVEDEITPVEEPEEVLDEEAPIITSAPAEGEEVYVPHPVILGDYADALPEPEPVEALEPEAGVEATAADEVDDEVLSIEEPATTVTIAEDLVSEDAEAEVEEPAAAAVLEEDEAAPVAEADDSTPSVPEGGYEATGELKLDEYTCQDCVYANTCPKVGQTAPAECGSFQWRTG
ncbi:MAG: hypothetical protein Q7W51_06360 [Coriobacteriia bacterium]|nr:hypothetical protein [Coriobacteriia bacterium]